MYAEDYSLKDTHNLSAVFTTFTLAALLLIATYCIKYQEPCFRISGNRENPEESSKNNWSQEDTAFVE